MGENFVKARLSYLFNSEKCYEKLVVHSNALYANGVQFKSVRVNVYPGCM